MMIHVVSPDEDAARAICAVNLACVLAALDPVHKASRWLAEKRVVLVDAAADGTATRYLSGGHMPVSNERLAPEDRHDMDRWERRIRIVMGSVDHVVVDGPSHIGRTMETILDISALVVVPYSIAAVASSEMKRLARLLQEKHLANSAAPPVCLFVPIDKGDEVKQDTHAIRLPGEIAGPPIQQWGALLRAFRAGQWIGDFEPFGPAHSEMESLAEIAKRILATNGTKNSRNRDHRVK